MSNVPLLAQADAWRVAARTAWRNVRGRKFEPEVRFIPDIVARGDVCLHVGASDGRHAYAMVRHAGAREVWAFEPSAQSYAVLTRALALNGLADAVHPVHAAIGASDGKITLRMPRKSNGRMGRSFAFTGSAGDTLRPDLAGEVTDWFEEETPMLSLDAFCAGRGIAKVDFFRIDCEGAEMEVLKGAAAIIERDKPSMLVEIHPQQLRAHFDSSGDAVVIWLKQRGYALFVAEGDGVRRVDGIVDDRWIDYFVVHPSRAASLPTDRFRGSFA
ncbi:MAG: FkbM family methyltransferase [Hyphomonadaceae bacterium]|nr:FkbM family methyltransferase [Hyphomonadaceae bacterium]